MSTASNNPPTPSAEPATSPAAPAATNSSSSSPAPPLPKSASRAPAAASKPSKSKSARRRKPVKRRGARAESESEAEDAQPGADDSASESDSDFAPSLHQSEDDEDEDDSDDEADGATEPKTPANASIEQLEAPAGSKGGKAVLAGQDLHPSWSDMPEAGEEGASELPTLDFANLSLDAVEAISPVKGKGNVARVTKDGKLTVGADGKPLSKKQLALQRREAKDAALKARDPAAWEAKQAAFAEKAEAKKQAKKERAKERKKEKKAQEKAAKEGGVPPAPAASTSGAAAPSAAPAAAGKQTRPVVPSRPSRTGLAYGLVNPSPSAPASRPIASSSATPTAPSPQPIVPAFRQQPAFIRQQQGQVGAPGRSFISPGAAAAGESWRGRGGAAMRGAVRGRGRGGARFGPDRWTADGNVVGEPVPSAPSKEDERKEGETSQERWGRGEAQRQQRPTAIDCTPNWSHAGFEELQAEEKARSTSATAASPAPPVAGRGRGRGRGGFAARGGGILGGPPGAINPRYAHLPFHPLHRYPALPASTPTAPAASSASSAAPSSSQPSSSAVPPPAPSATAAAPHPPAPESTAAANDQELFDEPAAKAEKPTVGVRLPSAGAAQFALAIKGAAAARAKEEAENPKPFPPNPAETKENEPIRSPRAAAAASAAAADLELRKQQGASILYAADPTRFAAPPADEASAPLASYEQQPQDSADSLPPHLSGFLHQVPPHLQSPPTVQAPFIPRHDSPVYYPPQQFYSPDAFSMIPSPGITPPPVFPSHAPPSSAYFVPPRQSKRVEIKAPSRDGQSPVPIKPSPAVPSQPSQLQQQYQQQQQAPLWQQQPSSSYGSPGLARAPLPPTSPPLQPQNPYGAPAPPPSSYYGYSQSPYDAHPSAAYDGGYYGMHAAPPPATQHTYQQPVGGAYNPYAAGPAGHVDSYGGQAYYGGGGEQQQWGMY